MRRPSATEAPLSPSAIPDLALLPEPLAPSALPVGQLVSKSSKLNPSTLEDRDYDDAGTRWYKDVIIFDETTGRFLESLGSAFYIQKQLEKGTAAGTIEAESQRVRMLKDEAVALKKVLQAEEAKQFLKENDEVGFVVAIREVTNASYKRARLVDRGANCWEVVREVGGEGQDGKRRDSGLDVQTGSKTDLVGAVVKRIVMKDEEATLGGDLEVEFWS